MDLLFGVSRICTLFLWGCICFPPQKGCNIAHGYYVHENPQTSNQFHSLNTELKDTTQVTGEQSFVSPQREPVHFDVTSLGEHMVLHQPDSGQEQDEYYAVSSPAVQKYESTQHPFGVLLKQHTPETTVEGISFPTIKDFRRFIETMKSSYLKPGSDSSRHFQTARETMKNELTSGAEMINGESSISNSVQDGSAHDDRSKNVVWSEPDANDHKPMSESLSFFNPVDSTESVISPSGYDDQESGSSSAFYSQNHLGATEQVLSDYGSLANDGISGENRDIFSSAADVQNEVQSTSHNLPEQKPPSYFLGGSHSFSGHVTASPVTNSPSRDLSFYSSKKSIVKPLTSEKTMTQPTYSSPSGDSLTGYQQSIDFQREEQPRMTEVDVLSLQKPLNSYGKSIFVSAPRSQFYIPDVSKHKEIPAKLSLVYKPTVGKESNNINSAPIIHLPVSNFHRSPQRSSSHVGIEASEPRDQVFSIKQPLRSYLFSVKPSSSQESSRHDGYLPNQRVSVSHPSISAQAKPEISDLSNENLVSAIQEPKQMNDYASVPPSNGLDSTQRGISSQINDVHASYPTNSHPNSKLKVFSRLFGNEAKSKNFEVRDISSDRFLPGDTHGTKKTQDSRGVSLNGGSVSDTTADPLHTFTQPTIVQKHPANVIREPSTRASRPSKTLSTSKVSASIPSGVFWRKGGNTKRLPPKRGTKQSPKNMNTYVKKSRNSYVRSKVFLSNTRYSPYQHVEDKTAKDQWKSDPRQQRAPLFEGGGEPRKNQYFQ
ncbi:uro-adherence factor A-like [Paralichthys olivaceus]|uniref:uro-adherence factor A-like n=1 Tax=Paralichthys olivaceus TaxID=8255 RepID=UPI00375239D0